MLQNLLDEYRRTASSLTEKEKAILERRIWVEVKKTQKYRRYSDWVKDSDVGLSIYKCQNRMAMINSGDWINPLWERIDGESKMPLSTAVKLLKKAKAAAAETGRSGAEVLQEVLDEYDNDEDTIVSTLADGRVFRKKKPKTKIEEPRLNGHEWEVDVENAKKLWALLDTVMGKFLKSRLKGLDQSVREDLTKDFIFQIRAVYEDLMKEVTRHRKDLKREAIIRIGAYKLRQACEALGVPTPKPGDPVNIQEAKVRYRRLAARFHPDRNAGQENMIKQYHAVNEALETIKMYMENIDG